jgi:hypothetical protein
LREKHIQLTRKYTDLEKLLAKANTRVDIAERVKAKANTKVDTAERVRAKAVVDREAAITKIQYPICYKKGIRKVTTYGYKFCREYYEKHFQISSGGDLGFKLLPCPIYRKMVFPKDSRLIYGLN